MYRSVISSLEGKEQLNQLITTKQGNINEKLEKKIDYVTQSFSQNFLKNKLKNLARKNPDNANVICDYIIVEQTEFNIKDSTKNGKIKALCISIKSFT
jgi:hypothetical protein